jgi:hypothetical protein
MSRVRKQASGGPEAELQQEVVLTARAERRLVEHELTRRRTLLALTVVLTVVGAVLAILGEPSLGVAFGLGAVASGAGPRGRGSAG